MSNLNQEMKHVFLLLLLFIYLSSFRYIFTETLIVICYQGICSSQEMLNRCHTGFCLKQPGEILWHGQLINCLSAVTLDVV